jgi:hypothetical protein
MNMEKLTLSNEQVERFNRDGFLVIENFYAQTEVRAVQLGIYNIIGRVLQRHGLPDDRMPFSAERFDDGFNAMIRLDRSLGAEVYDAIKQIPAFIRLLSSAAHEDMMERLRPGSQAGIAASGYGIRIDNPNEDQYRVFLHQEYPAQLRSLNGLVFWSPLVPITEEIGPVNFYSSSQSEGPLPVITDRNGQRQGAYSLRLHNEKKYTSKYSAVAPLSNPGDVVIIDFLVLHASGINQSQRSRWTMQFRYFDFSEPTGMSHGWQGSYASGVDFRDVHPELCKD